MEEQHKHDVFPQSYLHYMDNDAIVSYLSLSNAMQHGSYWKARYACGVLAEERQEFPCCF